MSYFDRSKSHLHVDAIPKAVLSRMWAKTGRQEPLVETPHVTSLTSCSLPNGILSSAQPFIKEFLNVAFQFASDLFYILM